eukprot:scaffold3817_cov177-Ochromonas_danica.AAC.10
MISEAKNEGPEDPRLDLSNSEVSLASSVSSQTSFPPDASSSVISRYIARFRYAPPTSPSERDYGTPAEPEAFWWLDEARRQKKRSAEAPSSPTPGPASDLGGSRAGGGGAVRRHDDALLRFIEEEEEAAARHPHSLPQPIDISSVRGRGLPSRAAAPPPSPPKATAFASPSSPNESLRDSRQQQQEEEEEEDREEDEDSLEARTQRLLRQCESVLAAYHRDNNHHRDNGNGRGPLQRSLDSTTTSTSSVGDSEMSHSLRESVESNSTILSQSSEKEDEESEEEEEEEETVIKMPTTSIIDPISSPSSASYKSSPPPPPPARTSRSPIPPRPGPSKGASAPGEDDESASFYLSASSSSGLLSLQSLVSSLPTTASVEQSRNSVDSVGTIVQPDEQQQLEGDERSGEEDGPRAEGVAETKRSPIADAKKPTASVPAVSVSSAAEIEMAGGLVSVTTVPTAGQEDAPLCVNYELVAPYLDDELLNQLWLRLQAVNQQLEDLRMLQS